MYSLGSFVFITTRNRQRIIRTIEMVRSFPDIQHAEVWLEPGEWNADDTNWLKGELQGLPVIIHAPFVNLSLVSDHAALRQASYNILARAIEHGDRLGAAVMTIHAGRKPSGVSDDQAHDYSFPLLTKLQNLMSPDMKLSLENQPAKSGSSSPYPGSLASLMPYLEALPWLYATIDIGHAVLGGEDYITWFRRQHARVADMHIHNVSEGGRDHSGFDKPDRVGVRELFTALRDVGYEGFVSQEVITDADPDGQKSWDALQSLIR